MWSHSSSLHGLCTLLIHVLVLSWRKKRWKKYVFIISLEKIIHKCQCFRYIQDSHCHGKRWIDLSPVVMIHFNSRKVRPQTMGMNEILIMLSDGSNGGVYWTHFHKCQSLQLYDRFSDLCIGLLFPLDLSAGAGRELH